MSTKKKKKVNLWNKLAVFLICCTIVDSTSKMMLDYENSNKTDSIEYFIIGITAFFFMFLGFDSLISISLAVKNKNFTVEH